MVQRQRTGGRDPFVRRYQYDDQRVIAIDVGRHLAEANIDIVDETVIVASDASEQLEFDLPSDDAEVFMKNGIITVQVPR